MNREEHIKFIKSDLSEVLQDTVATINLLGDGLEFYAVNNYVLQYLLLQMTGAQEQKMKCICWEMATDNLAYRYKRYYKKWELSECSTLADKSKVYEDLAKAIKVYDSTYTLFVDDNDKKAMLQYVLAKVDSIFENTNLQRIHILKYKEFQSVWQGLVPANLAYPSLKNLFHIRHGQAESPFDGMQDDEQLFAIYTLLYRARNRYAHNATSYQMNLPRFYEINDAKYQMYNNVFLFYAELLLVDEMFRKLFDKYQSVVEFA
jgi:hypothetical protein